MQQMLTIEMWRQGASQKEYAIFNFLGLSQCAKTGRDRVDKLLLNHDDVVKAWKSGIQVYI